MSLLMEALRKAEEAKRKAATQQQSNAEQQLTASPATATDLSTVSVSDGVAPLDLETDPEKMMEWETEVAEQSLIPPPTDMTLAPFDEPLIVIEQAAIRAESEMTLSARELLTTSAAEVQTPTIRKASFQAGREENETDIAALGSAMASKARTQAQSPTQQKAAEELQRRETVRASFNARIKQPNSGRPRMMGLLLVLLLIPLSGGIYWLLASGMIGDDIAYTLPPSIVTTGFAATEEVMATEEVTEEVVTDADLAATDPGVLGPDVVAPNAAPDEAVDASRVVESDPEEPRVDSQAALASALTEIQQALTPVATTPEDTPVIQIDSTMEVAQSSATSSGQGINVVRSLNAPRLDPVILQAYSSFQTGDYVDARALYQQALRTTPNNRDALLGLAAVALQMRNSSEARAWYARLLEQDPRDVLARTGLLETMPASDPVQLESELRSLFATHPNIAPLAFALGNLYASQGRWTDAQQSYYDALLAARTGATGPVSPDYAFNLAVSLEQLNQIRPAHDYYREAQTLAQQQQPTFDYNILQQRLDALEQALR